MNYELLSEKSILLRTICPVWDFNNLLANVEILSKYMYSFMRNNNGIGLAAPQLGLLYRIFIMGDDERFWVCINPEILEKSVEEVIETEGCLSFPGLFFKVKRSEYVKVKYFDISGNEKTETLTGIWSRCFQHELDHLNGVLFTEKVSKLVLDMAKKKRLKDRKKNT